jgi:hypothetical protein
MFDKIWSLLLRLQLSAVVAVMTVGITLSSFFKRKRMSHENGAIARGRFRVVDNPEFPEHDFFTAGREFPCRIRHAAVLFRDDAKMCVRSAALKLADTRFDSPFDVLMNSGRVGLFWSARTTWEFRKTNDRGKQFVPYLRHNPQAVFGGGDSSRRDPESFSKLSYHSQTCFGFIDVHGTYFYCRYRLIPARDWDGVDSGALTQWWRDHNWFQNPLPDEQRTRNYLKDELHKRLEGDGTIEYRFQIQTRRRPPGPDPTWVTAQYDWDETVTPWHDVAHVTLEDALDYTESMLTWYDISNHPASLPVPTGVSIDDPHSVNNLRLATKRAAQARLLSYKLRGMPPKFPDSRYAPDWDPIPPMPIPPGPDMHKIDHPVGP